MLVFSSDNRGRLYGSFQCQQNVSNSECNIKIKISLISDQEWEFGPFVLFLQVRNNHLILKQASTVQELLLCFVLLKKEKA